MQPTRTVLVAGATGYIGRRLVGELVEQGHDVRCLARTPAKLDDEPWRESVTVAAGDLLDPPSLTAAFTGVSHAYYLVHSMSGHGDWEARDRAAALAFREAARAAGVEQIVYLGGLGDDRSTTLSAHLRSRQEVGAILADGPVAVTELRAAVIIGSGSASFEMLRHLVEVLPAMITPKWVDTRCQPIAIRDVLAYLTGVLGDERTYGRVLELGGADVLTYREMMQQFAEEAGLRRRLIVPVPVLSPRLSSLWIGLVTPLPVALARTLVDSLAVEVTVHDHAIDALVPRQPLGYREALRLALRRVADLDVRTRWSDAEWTVADPMPTDPEWSGGTVLADVQQVRVRARAADVYATVCGIGGERGWLVADPLWRLRGFVDRLVGGIGMRRGRRHPDLLRIGDALDFWRVEALEPGRLVRLRAEMRLPGAAWLEWRIHDDGTDWVLLEQRARFHPRGLIGRAYWYVLLPFHHMIFGPLARRLGRRAESRPSA